MDNSWKVLHNRDCPECGMALIEYPDHVECIGCDYQEHLCIINSSSTGFAYGGIEPTDLISKTLSIDCELITLRHKELDIEFELNPEKLNNIEVIEINGHRFVRDKK